MFAGLFPPPPPKEPEATTQWPASLVLDSEGLAGEPWEGSGARLGL